MTQDEIRAHVATLLRATKADAEPPFDAIAALVASSLVDLNRIADTLEGLLKTLQQSSRYP